MSGELVKYVKAQICISKCFVSPLIFQTIPEKYETMFCRSEIGQQGRSKNVPTQHLAFGTLSLPPIESERENDNCYSLKCVFIAQPKQDNIIISILRWEIKILYRE